MMRTALFVLLVALAATGLALAQYEKMAVVPFTAAPGLEAAAAEFAGIVEKDVTASNVFNLADQVKVAKEAKLAKTPKGMDLAAAVKLGKKLAVQMVAFGTVEPAKDKVLAVQWKVADVALKTIAYSTAIEAEPGTPDFQTKAHRTAAGMLFKLTGTIPGVVDTTAGGGLDVTVTLVDAFIQRRMDVNSPSDPYAELHIGEQLIGVTKIVYDNEKPYWYHKFILKGYKGQPLKFVFWDKDVTKNNYIGTHFIDKLVNGSYDIIYQKGDRQLKAGVFKVTFDLD